MLYLKNKYANFVRLKNNHQKNINIKHNEIITLVIIEVMREDVINFNKDFYKSYAR